MKAVSDTTASRLKELGYPQDTFFCYIDLMHQDGRVGLVQTEDAKKAQAIIVAAAPTAGEIMDWLPSIIPIALEKYDEWSDLGPGVYKGYLEVEKAEGEYTAGYVAFGFFSHCRQWTCSHPDNLSEALGRLAVKVLKERNRERAKEDENRKA